jgi:23S rRNA (uracil1939-C5)-methyltransferase
MSQKHGEKTNRKFAEGRVEEVIEAAPERIQPHCPHFAQCGGCSMQHVASATQLQFKQRSVAEMGTRRCIGRRMVAAFNQ